jgi:hypothetical protein
MNVRAGHGAKARGAKTDRMATAVAVLRIGREEVGMRKMKRRALVRVTRTRQLV